MPYDIVLAHIGLCLVFFLILNWIGAHSYIYGYKHLTILYRPDTAPLFNLTFRMAAPLVYIIVVSAALYTVHLDRYVQNIFLVIVYYFLFRITFNVVMGYGRLLNWFREAFLATFCIAISFYLYKKLIVGRTFLFPNATTIANEIWIGIVAFIYTVGNKVTMSGRWSMARKSNYLSSIYTRLHSRYDQIVSGETSNPHLAALTYAVMIYENFNRPWAIRAVERLLLTFSKPRTIGIMQVRTNKNISDEDSVRLGVKKIVEDWEHGIRKDMLAAMAKYRGETDIARRQRCAKAEIFRQVIAKYNGGSMYGSEISYLYTDILKKFYPNVTSNILEPWRNV